MTFGYTYLPYGPTHTLSIIVYINNKALHAPLIVTHLSMRSARNTMSTRGALE